MDIEEAKKIYKYPKEHTKEELTLCLNVLNAISNQLTIAEQTVIADAKDRLDILEGVIYPKYRVK